MTQNNTKKQVSKPVLCQNKSVLSRREAEVLRAAARGCSIASTAGELNISTDTVESHRRNIFKKLQARSIAEAIAKGYQQQILK